ncbi:RCC1 domain-containing protein [Chryseobacterium sp. CT-SW4]|uniref:hypothetical protein n=1 Tax=Chryseobacterium sp. SW-1 TaxID=3157343 RepID=UPI003B0184A1
MGYNAFGQLGTSNTQVYLQTPTLATFFANDPVKDVKANFYNLLVLTESGKVYMTGWDGFRLKGDGTTTDAGYIQEFRQVPFPTGVNVQSISLGFSAAAALDSNGNAYTWGYNYEYATGQGINTLYTYAPTIINPDGVKFEKAEIAASGLAVVEGGKDLYAWGVRRNVGMEVTAYDTRPTLRTSTLGLAQDETIVNINIGSAIPVEVPYLHPSFVITDKRVLTSGYNFYGRSGVVEPGGAIRYELNGNTSGNNSFYEIQGHAIYEGTQFLGATVGYFHTILWTGTNALNAAYNYTGYGTSGLSDWYMSDGGGSHTSVFTKIIE